MPKKGWPIIPFATNTMKDTAIAPAVKIPTKTKPSRLSITIIPQKF